MNNTTEERLQYLEKCNEQLWSWVEQLWDYSENIERQHTMSAIPKINSETTVEIYSIDKNVINLNGTRDLIQRSGPVRLSEGLRVAREWEDRGHVIEVRRVSQRSS